MGAVRQGRMLPYILLSPLVVFIGALSFIPTVDTTVEAFFRVMPLDPPARFTGLGNFRALFADPVIITSWVNTAVYVAIGVVASVVLGTAMAVALKQSFRLRGVILALVILPWALPAVVEAVIWSWIYNPTFGVLNSALHSAHAIGGYHVWLGLDRWLTILLIEIVQVWQITPLSALVILAALQSVPQDLYEAARVDGAGPWRTFWKVTFPILRPVFLVLALLSTIWDFGMFTQAYIVTGDLGNRDEYNLGLYEYSQAFTQPPHYGLASAAAFVLTIILLIVTVGYVRAAIKQGSLA